MTSCPRFHRRFLGLHVPVALLSQNQLSSIPLTCPDPALKGKRGGRGSTYQPGPCWGQCPPRSQKLHGRGKEAEKGKDIDFQEGRGARRPPNPCHLHSLSISLSTLGFFKYWLPHVNYRGNFSFSPSLKNSPLLRYHLLHEPYRDIFVPRQR